jgi:hypothetical protein
MPLTPASGAHRCQLSSPPRLLPLSPVGANMRAMFWRCASLAILGVGSACRAPAGDAGLSDTVTPSLTISREAIERAPTLELRESLRIRSDTGRSPAFAFSRIAAVRVALRGEVVVVDYGKRIYVFGPDGRIQNQFGRAGQGPGELDGYTHGVTMSGDTIVVYDNRLQAFALDGKVLFSRAVNAKGAGGGTKAIQPIFATARGWVMTRGDVGGRHPNGVGRFDSVNVHVADSSQPSYPGFRQVLSFPAEELFHFDAVPASYFVRPFGSRGALTIAAGGEVLYTSGRSYDIDVFALEGQRLARVHGDLTPVPVPRRDLDSMYDAMERLPLRLQPDGSTESPDKRQARMNAFRRVPPSATRPVLGPIIAGDDSVLMVVRRDLTPSTCLDANRFVTSEATTWDIISLGRGILGRITLPPRFCPDVFRAGRIYGFQLDDNDVPEIVRFDIVGLPPTR